MVLYLHQIQTTTTMNWYTETYKNCTIKMRSDIKSHCAVVLFEGIEIKWVSGDILSDGSNNAIDKAKHFIDSIMKKRT